MTLQFTLDQMIQALTKAGYEIKKEKEKTSKHYYNHEEIEEVSVYNVYYKNHRIDRWDYLYGTSRVESVFEEEIRKRILKLF